VGSTAEDPAVTGRNGPVLLKVVVAKGIARSKADLRKVSAARRVTVPATVNAVPKVAVLVKADHGPRVMLPADLPLKNKNA
jgi:hypothetical protein